MKYKIVKEPSRSLEYIFFNLYIDGQMISSHSTLKEAETALTNAMERLGVKPEIVKEGEI